MTPLHLLFYIYAAIAVISALVVITVRHPVRSVLSLVVTFFAMAGLWMILHAEFLSLILVLVYVGAVMTLFLFVVKRNKITGLCALFTHWYTAHFTFCWIDYLVIAKKFSTYAPANMVAKRI
jgi:NADH:ubiquinone oxidoreductase subunit 6 (subunit J)